MVKLTQSVSDLGELRLLREVLLADVSGDEETSNDDCAHLDLMGNHRLLWSIDPCPTPVAHWFGLATAEVLGWYAAIINLSDIAASGGTPLAMLMSIEMPDDTEVEFVRNFQTGLMRALRLHNTRLMGGNVKSAKKFSATGTIVGVEGTRRVTRKIACDDCLIYIVGPNGRFWSAVVGFHYGWEDITASDRTILENSLLSPLPMSAAGKALSLLAFEVACMDCSDGAANSIKQLSEMNDLDAVLHDAPSWSVPDSAKLLLTTNKLSLENACYGFGDWQLVCLVPKTNRDAFLHAMRPFGVTELGYTKLGSGQVSTESGRKLNHSSLNQNFSGGYNSIDSVDELLHKFMKVPIFD